MPEDQEDEPEEEDRPVDDFVPPPTDMKTSVEEHDAKEVIFGVVVGYEVAACVMSLRRILNAQRVEGKETLEVAEQLDRLTQLWGHVHPGMPMLTRAFHQEFVALAGRVRTLKVIKGTMKPDPKMWRGFADEALQVIDSLTSLMKDLRKMAMLGRTEDYTK